MATISTTTDRSGFEHGEDERYLRRHRVLLVALLFRVIERATAA